MEYSPELRTAIAKMREQYRKKLTSTTEKKLKAGYKFFILIHNGYGSRVYFRKRESAEHWLNEKFGYTDKDQVQTLVMPPKMPWE